MSFQNVGYTKNLKSWNLCLDDERQREENRERRMNGIGSVDAEEEEEMDG